MGDVHECVTVGSVGEPVGESIELCAVEGPGIVGWSYWPDVAASSDGPTNVS